MGEDRLITPQFGLAVVEGNCGSTVHLSGEIDFAAALELTPKLEVIAQACEDELLFDLQEVTLIDSEGIKMLLALFDLVYEKGCTAYVVAASDCANRVIQMAGLSDVLGCGQVYQPEQSCWRIPSLERNWQV